MSEPTTKELWQMLYSKIQTEVTFIQSRMSVFAQINGMLFAAFGLILTSGLDQLSQTHFRWILTTVGLYGLIYSFFTFASLRAAGNVIIQVDQEWSSLLPEEAIRNEYPRLRPKTGSIKLGLFGSWGVALILGALWLVAGVAVWVTDWVVV